jgi:hypothetical protein
LSEEKYTIVANPAMQRWVDDAAAFPRAVPARLRGLLGAGIAAIDDGLYFAAEVRDADRFAKLRERMPGTLDREAFVNAVWLDTLRPVKLLDATTESWAYECVAIGIAFGRIVLDACAEVSDAAVEVTINLEHGDEVEHPSSSFRFTTGSWAGDVDDYDTAVLVMRRGVAGE